jgi:hypothetical protein
MLLCFPVLGISVFSPAPRADASRTPQLVLRGRGVEARGGEVAEGFVIRAGSQAVIDEVPSVHAYLVAARRGLVDNGVLRLDGGHYVFTQDYVFGSPSTAAGVVLGRSANGRVEWQTAQFKTLKALQEQVASE